MGRLLKWLGLRRPIGEDFRWGIAGGIGVFVVYVISVNLWIMVVPPEQFAEQTRAANQIALAINTLPLAFTTSVFASVTEEILFRGALQPVLGLLPTSLIFAVLHSQYTFNPAVIIIFIVSLAFGWLRQNKSTTAAILAHFLYNFIQLACWVLFGA